MSGCRRFFCDAFRRVYGYVDEIKFLPANDDRGAPAAIDLDTPALLQIVVKMRRRYGSSAVERCDSHLFCRVQAFTSTSAFKTPSEMIFVGDPASGLLEATSGEHLTAQLTGWWPVGASEWRLRHPQSFHENGFELNGDAIAVPPKLFKTHVLHHRLLTPPYDRLSCHRLLRYMDPFVAPEAGPAARDVPACSRPRGRPLPPNTSPERRMRDRFYAMMAA